MHESTFPIHSPPDPVVLPGLAHPAPAPLRTRDLALALLGLLALGGAAALGGSAMGPGLRLIPSVLLVELPALGLTAPALIAVHQFLRLGAAPEQLAAALGRALIHAGRVAGGLAVVVLFFAATTRLATPMLAVALAGVGVFTSATACVELTAVERRAARVVAPPFYPNSAASRPARFAGGPSDRSDIDLRFTLLLIGWLSLSWLVALRVGADVAMWVLGYGGLRA